jgi:hemerythrin
MKLEWSNDLRLGVKLVFRQHLELFALAQKLVSAADAPKPGVASIEFYSYMQKHFSDQSSLMREINFPGYRDHIELHSQLLSKFNKIRNDIAYGGSGRDAIEAFMTQDLLLHICEDDAKIAAHFRASMDHPQEQQAADRKHDRRLSRRPDQRSVDWAGQACSTQPRGLALA